MDDYPAEHSPRLAADSPREDGSPAPPDTILVRYENELLLLDAWNADGDKLRTPPSLIGEAIAHFGLQKDVSDYRLGVHDKVDDRPALLFLGLSALRFIENGRVLELVDVSESKRISSSRSSRRPSESRREVEPGSSWATEDTAKEDDGSSSDSSLASSMSVRSSGSYKTPQDTPLNTPLRPLTPLTPATMPLPRGRKIRSARQPLLRTATAPTPQDLSHHQESSDDNAYVYIHPRYGSLFRQRKVRDHIIASEPPTATLYPPRIEGASLQEELDNHTIPPREHLRSLRTFDFRQPPAAGFVNLPSALPTPVEDVQLNPILQLNPIVASESNNRPASPMLPPPPIKRSSSHASHLSRLGSSFRPGSRRPDDDPWLSSQGSESWRERHLQGHQQQPQEQVLPRSTRRFRSHEVVRPGPMDLSAAESFGLPRPIPLTLNRTWVVCKCSKYAKRPLPQ